LGGAFAEEWVCDVMGPSIGKVHVLVCVCRATRWTELIPLRSLTARSLADGLLTHIFARFGPPEKLYYDQQSGLMSDLMQSVLKLLRVHSEVAVANCHMKTAIAERKIRTVEQVLKSYVFQYKGRLTDLLPWIAFQMRQSECEVLGYSPHELTFGHNFRDRLTEMRDEFIGEIGKKERKVRKNVLKYLTDLRERIEINRDLATQQAIKSHKRIRAWYNKNANANKTFSTGDKVIILEPDDTRKLFARFLNRKL
jgi:hypothetical protein